MTLIINIVFVDSFAGRENMKMTYETCARIAVYGPLNF